MVDNNNPDDDGTGDCAAAVEELLTLSVGMTDLSVRVERLLDDKYEVISVSAELEQTRKILDEVQAESLWEGKMKERMAAQLEKIQSRWDERLRDWERKRSLSRLRQHSLVWQEADMRY